MDEYKNETQTVSQPADPVQAAPYPGDVQGSYPGMMGTPQNAPAYMQPQGGYPGYAPQMPPSPPKKKTGLIVLIVVIGVVVLGAAAAVVGVLVFGKSEPAILGRWTSTYDDAFYIVCEKDGSVECKINGNRYSGTWTEEKKDERYSLTLGGLDATVRITGDEMKMTAVLSGESTSVTFFRD